jgi:hypothetical protein
MCVSPRGASHRWVTRGGALRAQHVSESCMVMCGISLKTSPVMAGTRALLFSLCLRLLQRERTTLGARWRSPRRNLITRQCRKSAARIKAT